MLESLEIKSFRGIANLEIKGLSRINILVGLNGAGKTSILEAAALIANPTNPALLNSLATWREMPPLNEQSDYALRTIFSNLEENRPIEFSFKIDENSHKLKISVSRVQNAVIETKTSTEDLPQSEPQNIGETLAGVEYDYFFQDRKIPMSLRLTTKGFEVHGELNRRPGDPPPRPPQGLGCFYIHARRATSAGETSAILTSLYEKKQQSQFVQALRSVDQRILNLVPGFKKNQPIVLADIGLERLIPINALGDGFCRVLLMLTGLFSSKIRILIIDEIDSGLHPSVMTKFWVSLLLLSQSANVQVICSTHNEEMLQTTISAFSDYKSDLKIFRVDRTSNSDVKAQPYTYDTFESALKSGLDVR